MAHWISAKSQVGNSKEYDFFADAASDVANLPTQAEDVEIGSTCLVIATSEVYILDSTRTWQLL